MSPGARIAAATTADQIAAAAPLFDGRPIADAVARFLGDPDHHLLLAYDGERPIGFVSGVEVTHPDKGTEMFLYELAVEEPHRRRGAGTALVRALADLARDAGCYAMWVLTDRDNQAALATYGRAGGGPPSEHVMIEWVFGQD